MGGWHGISSGRGPICKAHILHVCLLWFCWLYDKLEVKTDFTYCCLITLLGWRKKAMCVPGERDIFAIHEWCLSAPALAGHTSHRGGDINPKPLCWSSTLPKIGLLWIHVFRSVKFKGNLFLLTSYQILQICFDRFSLIPRRCKKIKTTDMVFALQEATMLRVLFHALNRLCP